MSLIELYNGSREMGTLPALVSVKKKIDLPIWQGELRWTDLPNIDAGRNKQTLSAIESGQRWIDQYNLLSSSPNEKFKHTLQFFEYISINH